MSAYFVADNSKQHPNRIHARDPGRLKMMTKAARLVESLDDQTQ